MVVLVVGRPRTMVVLVVVGERPRTVVVGELERKKYSRLTRRRKMSKMVVGVGEEQSTMVVVEEGRSTMVVVVVVVGPRKPRTTHSTKRLVQEQEQKMRTKGPMRKWWLSCWAWARC